MTITEKRRLGDLGEGVACVFLEKHGYKILDRNYLRKWGEIDIVARKGSVIHFVEVKSVTHETSGYRPEDNVHPQKLRRLSRAMQTYLVEKRIDADWQLDIVTVKINQKDRRATCEMIENIII